VRSSAVARGARGACVQRLLVALEELAPFGVREQARRAELAGEQSYVQTGFDPWISRAPVHIAICVSEEAYRRRYREADKLVDGPEIRWPVPYWWIDAGASLQNILLAAVDAGLAAGFLGTHAVPGLKDLLGIPDEYTPIGVVTLGHPAPDRRSGSLERGWRPDSEVIHWGRWKGDPTAADARQGPRA
jgi:nitroreductase